MSKVFGWTPQLEAADRKLHEHELVREGKIHEKESVPYLGDKETTDNANADLYEGEKNLTANPRQIPAERVRYKTGTGVHIDDDQLTYMGDPIKQVHEYADGDGTVHQVFERIDPSTGKSKGTYEAEWQKEGETSMRHTSTRRIFS